METKLHSFVDFYTPSVLTRGIVAQKLTDHTIVRIESRDIKSLEFPTDAYGFRFFDVQTAVANGIQMKSSRLNISKMHFINGQIMSVKKALPVIKNRRLRARIKTEKWERLVLCNDGEFREFRHGDCIVSRKEN